MSPGAANFGLTAAKALLLSPSSTSSTYGRVTDFDEVDTSGDRTVVIVLRAAATNLAYLATHPTSQQRRSW